MYKYISVVIHVGFTILLFFGRFLLQKRMKKHPQGANLKGILKKSVSGLVLFELGCLAGSYLFYRRTNHNPEFRYTLYSKSALTKTILEGYYKLGETLNSEMNIREADLQMWAAEGKKL